MYQTSLKGGGGGGPPFGKKPNHPGFFSRRLPLDNFSMNSKSYCLEKNNDGFRFCPNVSFEDNEFKDNKALNDQGKGEGTNSHSPTQP